MTIKKATYLISSPSVEKCPVGDKPEIAFIGRSNVGKSSLINALCNKQGLAKTSSSPGKTQMINHFLINDTIYFVDLPGYGYAKVSQQQRKAWQRMIEGYFTKRNNLVQVFVLIDSRHQPQNNDLEFVHLLGQWQVPFALIFTKSDKEKQSVVQKNINEFLNILKKSWQFLPAHFLTSAAKKTGTKQVLTYLDLLIGED